MPHDEQAPPAGGEKLIQMAEGSKTSLLLGCDANCRHTVWGRSENNDRGESLFEYILTKKSPICYKGSTQTFVFPSCVEN